MGSAVARSIEQRPGPRLRYDLQHGPLVDSSDGSAGTEYTAQPASSRQARYFLLPPVTLDYAQADYKAALRIPVGKASRRLFNDPGRRAFYGPCPNPSPSRETRPLRSLRRCPAPRKLSTAPSPAASTTAASNEYTRPPSPPTATRQDWALRSAAPTLRFQSFSAPLPQGREYERFPPHHGRHRTRLQRSFYAIGQRQAHHRDLLQAQTQAPSTLLPENSASSF